MRRLFLYCVFLISPLAALQIDIDGNVLHVEVAKTIAERVKGLSGRDNLAEGTGMLFIFDPPQVAKFWMKGTLIPLAIGFFGADGILIEWKEMPLPKKCAKQLPIYGSSGPVSYALEVPKGWFRAHGIEQGAKLDILK